MSANGMRVAVWSKSSLVVALCGLLACASEREVAPQVTEGLLPLRDQAVAGKANVQKTAAAARDLVEQPRQDMKPQIDRLDRELASLETARWAARVQADSAQASAQAYFAEWDQKLDGMSKSVAEPGQKRLEESVKSFTKLRERLVKLRSELEPFTIDLKNSVKYLRTDTTAAGVKAVEPAIKQSLDREKTILDELDQLVADIDAIRSGR